MWPIRVCTLLANKFTHFSAGSIMKGLILFLLLSTALFMATRYFIFAWVAKGRMSVTAGALAIGLTWVSVPVLSEVTGLTDYGIGFILFAAPVAFLGGAITARLLLPLLLRHLPSESS